MPEYYLDIETNTRTLKPDVENDEILTIQFQRLESKTGEKKSDLTILKSWESSERDILERFHSIFRPDDSWSFVPIGFNLSFDFVSLYSRWKRIGIDVPLETLLDEHPYIDIKPILVIFNKGSFKGANLQKFAGKQHSGIEISEWYAKKDYAAIEEYIRDEADKSIHLYQFLKKRLPDIWLEFAKASKIII